MTHEKATKAPRVRASYNRGIVSLPKADFDELLKYQGFRGRRAERERILKYIERLATSTDTGFVAWSVQLSALARRIRRLRLR